MTRARATTVLLLCGAALVPVSWPGDLTNAGAEKAEPGCR